MNKKGSALILIIIVTSMIGMLTTYMLRSSAYMHNVALERQRYEQDYYRMRGIFNYAVALCVKNFSYFSENKGDKDYTFPLPDQLLYGAYDAAHLRVAMQDDTHILVTVHVSGKEGEREMQGIVSHHETFYALNDWQYH